MTLSCMKNAGAIVWSMHSICLRLHIDAYLPRRGKIHMYTCTCTYCTLIKLQMVRIKLRLHMLQVSAISTLTLLTTSDADDNIENLSSMLN